MIPIEFPYQTVIIAKDQPPYIPLPAYQNSKESISCWKLTILERIKILLTGKLWLRQCNFGMRVQPIEVTVDMPFNKE